MVQHLASEYMKSIKYARTVNLGDFNSLKVEIFCQKLVIKGQNKGFLGFFKNWFEAREETDEELLKRATKEMKYALYNAKHTTTELTDRD